MIKLEKLEKGEFFEDAFLVSYRYNKDYLNKMRSLKYKRYVPDKKAWEIPSSELKHLVDLFGVDDINVNAKYLEGLVEKEESKADEAPEDIKERLKDIKPIVDYPFKTKPFPHQIEAFNKGYECKNLLLADDQGLGKTKESIDTEVSQLCGVSTQTIKLWNKASEQREEAGEGRLIPAPHTEPNGYKYWSAEDTQKIIEYAIMGSQVYQLPYEDCREFYPDGTVNAEGKHRRTTMKSVLLGIMYERGATAIGEQFNKSAEWAQQLIDNFYKSFPKINQYRLKIENMAETYGYVTTITGRKRRLPDMQLEDKDDYRYQEAHRQSLNSVIQGSSADIMKLSMIAIYNDPRYKALDCHMIITVHDELIMEVPEDHIKEGAELLVGTMKRVGHSLIDLPMSVDAEVNDYWYGENLAEKYGV